VVGGGQLSPSGCLRAKRTSLLTLDLSLSQTLLRMEPTFTSSLSTFETLFPYYLDLLKTMQSQATKTGSEPNPVDTTGLCLLSLDGGGVRGLSTLFILKTIMDRLNRERRDSSLSPVKPCGVFDLIGGTSTGGYVPSTLLVASLIREASLL
jgi:hypothetical protein